MRSRTAVALLAASGLALTACGGGGEEGSGSGDDSGMDLATPGTLTVCADVPFPPFAFEEDGEYTGFDMELTRAIAKGMGLEHEVKDIGFEGLQSGAALSAGTCDIGAAAMTITKEREKNLDFSDPYYDSLQSLLVPAKSSFKLDEAKGKTIAVKQGTTGEAYAQKHAPKGAEIKSFPSNSELYPALESGAADAVMMDLPSNLQHQKDGTFVISEKYDTGEQYGMPVKTGNKKLLDAVNTELKELKDDGTYDKLYDKYFSE